MGQGLIIALSFGNDHAGPVISLPERGGTAFQQGAGQVKPGVDNGQPVQDTDLFGILHGGVIHGIPAPHRVSDPGPAQDIDQKLIKYNLAGIVRQPQDISRFPGFLFKPGRYPP